MVELEKISLTNFIRFVMYGFTDETKLKLLIGKLKLKLQTIYIYL